jgi:hypothetical protein
MAAIAARRFTLIRGIGARSGRLLVVGALTLLMSLGCGGDGLPRADVSGKVTVAGQPVTGGVIVFTPERGPQATSPLSPNGAFRLTTPGHGSGAVVGRHRISITPLYDQTPLADYDENSGNPPPQLEMRLRPSLPATYFSPQTSGLTAEVSSGENDINVALIPNPQS